MSTNLFSTVAWSVPFWPEWTTDSNSPLEGVPGEATINTDGGSITGLGFVQSYFYIFLNRAYFVYGYTAAETPLEEIKRVNSGCNFFRFMNICDFGGNEFLPYISDTGDIRLTSGPTYDAPISDKILPICRGLLGGRTMTSYYDGVFSNSVPSLFYDAYNKFIRVLYPASSTVCDKMLTYNLKNSAFTTASYSANSAIGVYDVDPTYIAVIGPSEGSGETYGLLPNTMASNKALTFDTGWIPPTLPGYRTKLYNVIVWTHAQSGCDTTLTFTFYNNQATNSAIKTETRSLVYNSSADNLQRIFVNAVVCGPSVRCVITDNGTNANYAIDKIILEVDDMKASN